MRHPESETISEYLDGELPPPEAAEMEAHLAGCPGCSALLRDLREIQERARSLEDQLPRRDLWPEISRTIREAGAADPQVIELHPGAEGATPLRRSGFRLSYPQAAAAGIVLALFSGALGAHFSPGPPPSGEVGVGNPAPWVERVSLASPGLGVAAREAARLEAMLALHREDLDPATARILEKNLVVIDQAIQESLDALRTDPGNAFLESHLAWSVESKASYLREATALVVPTG